METPDDVQIAVQSWGDPDGPPILFLHGFTANHLAWAMLAQAPELQDYHLVTYDMRGHGMSEKPLDPEYYQDTEAWAGEVQAVIEALDLERPILVGASYAGRVINDYLAVHGDDELSGLVYGASGIHDEPEHFGPGLIENIQLMVSDNLLELIDGTRGLIDAVTADPVPREAFERAVAGSMLVPRQVRAAMLDRSVEYEEIFQAIEVPVLVVHGDADELILPAASKHTAELVPDAELIVYDDVGHALWVEAADFSADLAEFAAMAFGK